MERIEIVIENRLDIIEMVKILAVNGIKTWVKTKPNPDGGYLRTQFVVCFEMNEKITISKVREMND